MKAQLKTYLLNNESIDLYDLFHQFQSISVYALINELHALKDELQLSIKLSSLVSQIDGLLPKLNTIEDPTQQIEFLCKEIDIAQRGHSMSRYIHLVDSHQTFTPTVDVVLFGDSITEWGPWQDVFTQIPHVNRGIAGDTTFGMLRRIETTLAVKPKLISIMAGINDLSQGFSVDSVFDNYIAMLIYWQKNNCPVLVQSTLYCGNRLAHLNPKVTDLNSRLESYCQQHNIDYLNVNKILSPNGFLSNDFTCDDLHLNANAYSAWINVLQPKLDELLAKN
ncbi:SGNH/GDSL hydrolase family protein [Aliivibrio sp. S2TY2]|uniref:SGNH/GDSL hydrolase family protein n=1 Tax=unclassified Aliivibrio TaxID=2645654 RepID=UPI00237902F0|nr:MULTISPECIES: SGNH/GDSL hydrolase family protein [unclassified Aliivibrio]MDD9174258.1 SGNH/GDSL hydrolase family protein [Aliivibrio sp. S3TY1]MDD9191335.1 SGNH/GDSL hydrolase family protein [Aliivibrio sp. S2TY2]